jgi:hypothetical protein
MSPRKEAGDVGAESLVQAFVETRSEDPEAVSALEVARARLAAGAKLRGLRRLRVFEVTGVLPGRPELEDLLHRSTRFYNPAKERCRVRASVTDAAPFAEEEALVLVSDRGLERRAPAERWWKHETGAKVEVREGVVWALAFEPGADAARDAASLAAVTDRAHGLLANPHFQAWSAAAGPHPPWPWLAAPRRRAPKGDA